MTIAAAREIRDGDIVFCGTGISMLAAMAAKHISAPNSVIFFETGAIDSLLEEVPLTVADSRIMFGTAVNGGLADAFATMQNRFTGRRVVGILGAAQIDRFGNLNSTVIGDYAEPRVRFSGSGGACDVASFVGRTPVFMQHERRKFVATVDYLTSPGWLDGPGARARAGLAREGRPRSSPTWPSCASTKALGRCTWTAATPGSAPGSPRSHRVSRWTSPGREPCPPVGEELRILRESCDPQRLILG